MNVLLGGQSLLRKANGISQTARTTQAGIKQAGNDWQNPFGAKLRHGEGWHYRRHGKRHPHCHLAFGRLTAEAASFSSKNTPLGQAFMHCLQPIQASAFLNTTCLCPKKQTLPIACPGHPAIHFQHAAQRCGFIATYAVVVLFIPIPFLPAKLSFQAQKKADETRLRLDYSRFLCLNTRGLTPVVLVNNREK